MFSSTQPFTIPAPILLKPEFLNILISLVVLPLMAGLLGQQQLLGCFLTVGDWCEDIFQGIALPFLEISE